MESRNFILTGSAAQYGWKGAGLCSVKTFTGGDAYYNIGKGSFKVDSHSFLVLNDGTEYTIEIAGKQPVHSFCLFFDSELLNEIAVGAGRPLGVQLDNIGHYPDTHHFFERTYPMGEMAASIGRLKKLQPQLADDAAWLQQEFFNVLLQLSGFNQGSIAARENLSAVRFSTRQELFRRLLLAREYIHANADQPFNLKAVALASHLSVNHLLRCFQMTFGCSPHAYATKLKMEQAVSLLTETKLSITEITWSLGFSSLGSFSLLFKKHIGCSPEAYRKMQTGDIR